jgi:hypothetical protein
MNGSFVAARRPPASQEKTGTSRNAFGACLVLRLGRHAVPVDRSIEAVGSDGRVNLRNVKKSRSCAPSQGTARS